ncbi:MAG: NUDIX hydrolase [Polyangiaceae bacterium]|jgi:phosphatase NudJ|nr:NUDIX hydrolase [Polyangiaceae bacterium]
MARDPIPSWFYALVVVRRGAHFLAIREASHGQGWYLPAGRCEAGERLTEAARRECLEETGIPVHLEGLLRIEHENHAWGVRSRVIFVGSPASQQAPKTQPDEHSLEARWVTLDELERLPLRHPEVLDLFRAVASGAQVAPLSLLREG